ncbi:MAG: Gfo/Idh/MocA family oxidoreductase [Lachnospiraceae bacterium]|nr:Gfo/Idh/MocA family oxidoreductase [Lachnospiraceae bacterium]
MIKFAILAAGGIAAKMSYAVSKLPEIHRYAVASRSLEKAETFAKEWGYEKAYGSYEEMLADPCVELVYVASPHSHHYEHAKMCIEAGKHVLVEKAFTVNAGQAQELIRLAREKNVLLTEAMWTRFMPARKILDDLIAEGVIGEIYSLTANLGYDIKHKERLIKPELAGGALLDVGVYPIQFALMAVHSPVKKISSDAVLSEEGVDLTNSITITFENGVMAVLHSSMLSLTDREGVIYGESGSIRFHNINNCEGISIYDKSGMPVREIEIPKQINGYEYEILACVKAIEEGRLECSEMPHEETIRGMEILDTIRKQWGMKYSCE